MRDEDDLPAVATRRMARATRSDPDSARPTPSATALTADGTPEREPYDEYVSELEKVPVLTDLAAITQRILQPDFRDGQRPDARRAARPDPFTVQEAATGEAAALYAEYSAVESGEASPARGRRKRHNHGGSPRGKGARSTRSGKGNAGGRSNNR